MKDKVVVITGANGGLGSAVTRAFLDAGARVVGVARKIDKSEFPDANFTAIAADLTDSAAVTSLAGDVAGRFGRVDAVVHVMGGFAGGTAVHETDDATWRRMLDLNLNSAFYAARAFLPHLQKSGAGRLIVIGSKTAEAPQPKLSAYVVSKAAVVMLVRTIAAENSAVTANVIMPDTMDTAANRAAMPKADFSTWVPTEEVAKLVLWLAGDEASHVTGAVIPITGRTAGK